MRTVFILFDSLNRHFLECYGSTLFSTPNFKRLAEKSVTFEQHHVGSLPCMPARRDIQTGRLNFMHRSWGPMEPFDQSVFQQLQEAGVHSHLITDHYHYFEEGAGNYHTKYSSYESFRGQEGDKWQAEMAPPLADWEARYHADQFDGASSSLPFHYMANRDYLEKTGQFPSTQCFDAACVFLDKNKAADNWLLQIETFDPHEPFFAPEEHRRKFDSDYDGKIRDWPPYAPYTGPSPEDDEMKRNYMALISHCDEQLGRVLDFMDEHDMWQDTMLVVSTDHGFLLGEHDWWAKNRMPCFTEIAHIPLFVHHPDYSKCTGERRNALTQTPDLAVTFCDAHNAPALEHATGRSVLPLIADADASNHDALIFGYFGGAMNLTDGQHTYFRYPENMLDQPLYQYTLMPNHMLHSFSREEFQDAELIDDLAYAQNWKVLRLKVTDSPGWYRSHGPGAMEECESALYDLTVDPGQKNPIQDADVEQKLMTVMAELMAASMAPPEAFERLGISRGQDI